MSIVLNKIKRVLSILRGFFPEALPIGMTEFRTWSDTIIRDYGFPDNDSVRGALATMIMHKGPSQAFTPRFTFYVQLRAGAAKQVAGAVFHEIKLAQEIAAKEARKAEATAKELAASSDQAT